MNWKSRHITVTYPDYIDINIEHLRTAKNSKNTAKTQQKHSKNTAKTQQKHSKNTAKTQQKVPIVVPKVPKKATFGTTIGTFSQFSIFIEEK